jgi:putative toxin-antitoxin system antitoxin component (TIGR02293 family)
MKRTVTKPKQPVPGRTKLSEILGATGKDNAFARTLSAIRAAGTPVASSARRKKPKAARVDPRVAEYAAVLAHAVDIFGSRIRANAWLNRPSRIFNNQSPIQVLTQDPEAVEEELVRIDEGIFF